MGHDLVVVAQRRISFCAEYCHDGEVSRIREVIFPLFAFLAIAEVRFEMTRGLVQATLAPLIELGLAWKRAHPATPLDAWTRYWYELFLTSFTWLHDLEGSRPGFARVSGVTRVEYASAVWRPARMRRMNAGELEKHPTTVWLGSH